MRLVQTSTAHPAFEKGALYFKVHIRKVPVNPQTYQVDVKAMRSRVDRNTIMIVGSFPAYPHGNFDPIKELSQLALQKRIGMHVDCCLGSFIVAFMERAGYSIPPFDFLLPGVTSISCDTHKFVKIPLLEGLPFLPPVLKNGGGGRAGGGAVGQKIYSRS